MTAPRRPVDWAEVYRNLDRHRDAFAAGTGLGSERRAEILRARTAALAGRRLRTGPEADTTPMATFLLGDERYALPLTALVAVVRDRPLGAVPGASATVVGVLYERGEIWTIHDPRRLLGIRLLEMPGPAPQEPGFLLLLRGYRLAVGLRVDTVGPVRRIALDRLGPRGPSAAGGHPIVLGVTEDAVAVLHEAGLREHPALTEVT